MKHISRLLLLFAFLSAPLAASAPVMKNVHEGSWVNDNAHSFWSNGLMPKDFAMVITLKFDGDMLTYYSVNTTGQAKAVFQFVTKVDDSLAPVADQPRVNQVRVLRLNKNEYQMLLLKDGDVIVGQIMTFSPDGKRMVRRGVGKAPDGHSKAFVEAFVRQK